jgi:3-oxoacyl-[acyl-carrier-protein] synthase-3
MVWNVRIAGVGRYLPKRVVSSAEVATLANLPPGWIEEKQGIFERRWADAKAGETATWMGAQAAREALDEAGLAASELELIVNASGTPEQAIPDGGPLLQRHLGLGLSGIPCFTMHATCLSFLVALDLAATYIRDGRFRRVLVVSSEVASVGLNFSEPESSTLFGDAAAAAVLVATPAGDSSRIEAMRFASFGDGADFTEIRGCGTRLHPNAPDADPTDATFHMSGPDVLRMAIRTAPGFFESLRPGLAKGIGDIDLVIPHQASLVGLKAFRRFGWPSERIVVTLDRLGNCVGASIPATLHEAVRSGRLTRGQRFLLFGTGAGFSLGGAIGVY